MLPSVLRNHTPQLTIAAVAVVAGGSVGALGARNEVLGLTALSALLVAFLILGRPISLALLALAGVFFVQRVGAATFTPGSAGGVSYSDALLALAAFAALPALAGSVEVRRLRYPLLWTAVYLVALLPSIMNDLGTRAAQEWLHRLVLVAGAMIVGAWIVRESKVPQALRIFLVLGAVLAVCAVADWFTHGFRPAAPFQLNKNFIGSQFAASLTVATLARRFVPLNNRMWTVVVVLLAAGLLVSQSRGAQLSAVFSLLLGFLFAGRGASRRGKALASLVGIVLAVFAYSSIHDQQAGKSTSELSTNSIGVRLNVEKVTRQIWRTSPVYGVGLKYFTSGRFGYFAQAPNNVIDNELAESGVIGATGFLLFQGGVLLYGFRRRRQSPLIAAGVAAAGGMLLHGMVDIYWTAGVVALPFLVFGMGIAYAEERPERKEEEMESRRPRFYAAPPPGPLSVR